MPADSIGHDRLKRLMQRGTDFLGCEVAILGGAMSWISERNLVSAISNAGGFGVIACGAMTPDLLDTEIAETKKRTDRPFGVNLITMHPALSELIDVCAKHEVSHVVLAGGLPPGGAIDRIKGDGAKLICFAPALALAKKLIRSGVDALVIEGMEAGGHIGPVSTSVLAQEILPPLAADDADLRRRRHRPWRADRRLSRNGRGRRAARHPLRLRHTNASPIPISRRPSSAPRRATRSPRCRSIRGCRSSRSARSRIARWRASPRKQREVADLLDQGEVEMAEAQLQIEHYWAGALRRAVIEGDVETGSVMAGQSVGMVKEEAAGRRHHRASWSTRPRTRWSGGRCTPDARSDAGPSLPARSALAARRSREVAAAMEADRGDVSG